MAFGVETNTRTNADRIFRPPESRRTCFRTCRGRTPYLTNTTRDCATCFPRDDAHVQTRRALMQLIIDGRPAAPRTHRTIALRAGPRRAFRRRAVSTPRACPVRYKGAYGVSPRLPHRRMRNPAPPHKPRHAKPCAPCEFPPHTATNTARLELNDANAGNASDNNIRVSAKTRLGNSHVTSDMVQGGMWLPRMSFIEVLRTVVVRNGGANSHGCDSDTAWMCVSWACDGGSVQPPQTLRPQLPA